MTNPDDFTLEEKAGLVSGGSFWGTRAVPRLGIEPMVLTDGPHGVRLQSGGVDHLGVNDSHPATCFPTASATGSSWDPPLIREMGAALAAESRALGVDVLLGPGINIKRHPLCGRNFEYLSEDPHHAGVMAAAWVEGLQCGGVGASVKHFAANNQETDRMRISAEVDERTLREIYLPAFEAVVMHARPASVMSAYNRVNGTHASEHHWLLTEVLRDEWAFDGIVVSDWGGVHDPVAALVAGLDLEMPTTGDTSPDAILAAVRSGALDESMLDRAVSRLLEVRQRIVSARAHLPEPADDGDAHELARRIACASAVLLTNKNEVLPLDSATGGSIAVIGEFARSPSYQGGGSSHVMPTRLDDALTAIGRATDREVEFAPGFTIESDPGSGPDTDPDPSLLADAVAAAERAGVVLLFLGLPDGHDAEGSDRPDLDLPEAQLQLLRGVGRVADHVVVVLANGGVVSLDEVRTRSSAILEMWLAGQAGGSAAADLIFGRAEPGGRLAETIPLRLTDTPAYANWPGSAGRVLYGERIYVGYRWYDHTAREVCFPFGHGLGYTTFAYSDLAVTVPDPQMAQATVEVTLANTGDRAGTEVVQVYVGDPEATVDRPPRELRAFSKVHLAEGQSARVRLELDERAFAFWGEAGWVVEPGHFTIEVGASSRDIRCSQSIELDVPAPTQALTGDSTVAEWADHPIGGDVLRSALAMAAEQGIDMTPEEILDLTGSMPLRTLLSYQADADVDGQLTRMIDAVSPEL